MDAVLGAGAGLAAGALAGFVVAVVQLQCKRWRNAWLVARGAVGYKDCCLAPLWIPGAVQGAIIGAVAGELTGACQVGALASLVLPAVMLVASSIAIVGQCRRPLFDRS